MNFKKDYLNYVLQNVIITGHAGFSPLSRPGSSAAYKANENIHIINVLEYIIRSDDFVKSTFLIGKTAGLELLFKYLLYIYDKIDKSQVTIFNIKDNFDYDVQNLRKICEKIDTHTEKFTVGKISESVPENSAKKIPTNKIKIELNTEKEIPPV